MVLSSRRQLGDLLKEEFSTLYCREGATIKNTAGEAVTLTDPLGYPYQDVAGQRTLLLAGEEVYATGIILEVLPFEELADDGISKKKVLLERGPATIDRDQLPAEDVLGNAFDLDDLEAALLQLGIVCRREPEQVSEQVE